MAEANPMLHLRHSRIWSAEPRYSLFLRWSLLAGLIAFGAWVAWDLQVAQTLLAADETRISLLITVVFLLGCLHCAVRSLYLSQQQEALEALVRQSQAGPPQIRAGQLYFGDRPLAPSLAESYLAGTIAKPAPDTENGKPPDQQLLAQVMAEQARGQHEAGWFVAGSLIKLGLLGTVIGFVLMLAPVTALESFDQSQVQNLLKQMTVGMGVALNTTLVGLVGTMLLGMQYLLIDRAADRLVAQTVHFTESCLASWSAVGE